MISVSQKKWILITLSLSLGCCLFQSAQPAMSLTELEQLAITFPLNETLDFTALQTFSYEWVLPLRWVGSHARVRVQGGGVTGSTPNQLTISSFLDGIKSSETFSKTNGLLKHYTFHSSSEYTLPVPPPIRPTLDDIQTLHNFTLTLEFTFSSTPDGKGFIKQVVFETFTPPTVLLTQSQPIIVLQDQFSWQISQWSFGRCFYNTSLIIPVSVPQNLSLSITVEFWGVTIETWQVSLQQEARDLARRDSMILEGVMLINPALPCELSIVVDPPQVATTELIGLHVELTGRGLPLPEPQSLPFKSDDRLAEKRFNEGLFLVQLGLVVVPLLTYYRIRRLKF